MGGTWFRAGVRGLYADGWHTALMGVCGGMGGAVGHTATESPQWEVVGWMGHAGSPCVGGTALSWEFVAWMGWWHDSGAALCSSQRRFCVLV